MMNLNNWTKNMPDISMCGGGDCPLKETCWRHKAEPGMRQSYFTNPPVKEDGTCDHYWEMTRR